MLPRGLISLRLAVLRGNNVFLLKDILPSHIGLLRNYSCAVQNVYYHNGLICQHFTLSAKRGVRTFPNDLHDRKHKNKSNTKAEQQQEERKKGAEDKTDFMHGFEQKKPSPEDVKRVRRLMLVFAVTATALTFMLFTSPEFKQISNPTETITMEELLNVYLPSGEVKKLIYVSNRNQLIAILYPGAMIQGGRVDKGAIVVQCAPNETYGSVTEEIREREKAMGIAPMAGLKIDNQELWSNTSYFALLLCMLLVGYLSARVTHRLLRRIFEVKGMNGTKKQK